MFAVIFEVQPREGRTEDYLALAKQLKSKLEATDGFIDNERFKSKRDPRRMLSLSTWRDEKAVVRWRTHAEHHGVQERGRFDVFEDYHLRVGEITFDDAPPQGLAVRNDRMDETQAGEAKTLTITEVTLADGATLQAQPDVLPAHLRLDTATGDLVSVEVFESIYHPGKLALLAAWHSAQAAERWIPSRPPAARAVRHRRIRVIRDYGMFDRREAPQYYPERQRGESSSPARQAEEAARSA